MMEFRQGLDEKDMTTRHIHYGSGEGFGMDLSPGSCEDLSSGIPVFRFKCRILYRFSQIVQRAT